jgi:hypothetical protein
VIGLALVCALPFGLATARPAPPADPAPLARDGRPATAAELGRLVGHRTERLPGERYRLVDVAGEGAPRIGVVERRGAALYLVEPDGAAWRLVGPLAVPRIAGPGYTVWVLGAVDERGALVARRLGVLAPPPR